MKKSFAAAAVLAAAGAASAQVTITGNYTFGYEQVTGGNGGLYTDTANVQFTAKEDLGNGLTATAKVTAAGLARSGGGDVAGEDAAVTLAGGFGSVELSSKETGNGTSGAWIAPGYGLDGGNLFGAATPKDRITFKLPAMGAIGLALAYTDRSSGAQFVGAGGTTGTVTNQNYLTGTVSYADGPLSAALSYTTFMHRNLSAKSQGFTVLTAYDAGVAKVAVHESGVRQSRRQRAVGVGHGARQIVLVGDGASRAACADKLSAARTVGVGKGQTNSAHGGQLEGDAILGGAATEQIATVQTVARGDPSARGAVAGFLGGQLDGAEATSQRHSGIFTSDIAATGAGQTRSGHLGSGGQAVAQIFLGGELNVGCVGVQTTVTAGHLLVTEGVVAGDGDLRGSGASGGQNGCGSK